MWLPGGLLHHHRRPHPAPHGQRGRRDDPAQRRLRGDADAARLVFDLFDGLVARKLRSSAMGAELDNLSDLISFGLAPAYFVLVWGMVSDDAYQRVSVVGAIVVLLAVVLRLARFSCVTLRDGVLPGHAEPVRRPDGRLGGPAGAAVRADAARDRGRRVADGEPGGVPQAARAGSRWPCSAGSSPAWRCWPPGPSRPPAVSSSSSRPAPCRSSWAR